LRGRKRWFNGPGIVIWDMVCFGYLNKLFPSLFGKKINIFSFQCDVCELVKNHRASFLKVYLKTTFIYNYTLWYLRSIQSHYLEWISLLPFWWPYQDDFDELDEIQRWSKHVIMAQV
jgi:hypothetical protein